MRAGNDFGIGGRISNDAIFSADTLTVIPEPSQITLLALGLPAFAIGARRRKRG